MDLWHIFVLSQMRLFQNISYDKLHHLANYDSLVRQIMSIESGFGYEEHQFGYQNIIDNVSLLDDETVKKLNGIIIEFGHNVLKKKRPLRRVKMKILKAPSCWVGLFFYWVGVPTPKNGCTVFPKLFLFDYYTNVFYICLSVNKNLCVINL